ncbi:phosphotyrosine-specific ptp2-like protein [Mycoemilia scoparia]|uniref:protein-tyrosine-phosphatase n=1 Tax=Mycoemilia scoparia TaxID=417184 RepID=A0A9W7ZY96_9FUNG|nr:phosphotyrosine-specific ptp2-like protein [Mycoemilia scoparia]
MASTSASPSDYFPVSRPNSGCIGEAQNNPCSGNGGDYFSTKLHYHMMGENASHFGSHTIQSSHTNGGNSSSSFLAGPITSVNNDQFIPSSLPKGTSQSQYSLPGASYSAQASGPLYRGFTPVAPTQTGIKKKRGLKLTLKDINPTSPDCCEASPQSPTLSTDFRQALSRISPIKPSDLAAKITSLSLDKCNVRGMIIDARPSQSFIQRHIYDAINVNASTTLLRRPAFTIERLCATLLLGEAHREKLLRWKSYDWIVVCGSGAQDEMESRRSVLGLLARKIENEAPISLKIYYVKGGFQAFLKEHPELCEASSQSDSPVLASGSIPNGIEPRPLAASMTCPSNPAHNSLLNSLQYKPGRVIETCDPVPMRLPLRVCPSNQNNFYIDRKDAMGHELKSLPQYLQRCLEPKKGAELMWSMFSHATEAEKRRLSLMISNNGQATEQNPFTFSAGVEMGTKNRYKNIFPFDYTRVKLSCEAPMYNNKRATLPTRPKLFSNSQLGSPVPKISNDVSSSHRKPQPFTNHFSRTFVQSAYDPLGMGGGLVSVDPGGPGSSYINASHVRYFSGPRYIAAQGPLDETTGDFWQMVWEQNVPVIVNLTREDEMGRQKCYHYWPDASRNTMRRGNIVVRWEAEGAHPEEPELVVRQFILSKEGTNAQRQVVQVHYTGWPDSSVPKDPQGVLRVRELARRAYSESCEKQNQESHHTNQIISNQFLTGPMVVHCSAGCGRTGAFCVIDTALYLLEHPEAEKQSRAKETSLGIEDLGSASQGPLLSLLRCREYWHEIPAPEYSDNTVFLIMSRLREQRIMMVQTLSQFVFCHEALSWHLINYRPKSIGSIIDSRLVSEWNRANLGLTTAHGGQIVYLLKGWGEMSKAVSDAASLHVSTGLAIGDISTADLPTLLRRSNTYHAPRLSRPSENSVKEGPSVDAGKHLVEGNDASGEHMDIDHGDDDNSYASVKNGHELRRSTVSNSIQQHQNPSSLANIDQNDDGNMAMQIDSKDRRGGGSSKRGMLGIDHSCSSSGSISQQSPAGQRRVTVVAIQHPKVVSLNQNNQTLPSTSDMHHYTSFQESCNFNSTSIGFSSTSVTSSYLTPAPQPTLTLPAQTIVSNLPASTGHIPIPMRIAASTTPATPMHLNLKVSTSPVFGNSSPSADSVTKSSFTEQGYM